MCFDPEYSSLYNYFLSRKSSILKLVMVSFKVLIVYVLLFSAMCLYLFIDCTLCTRSIYKNIMGRYLNK